MAQLKLPFNFPPRMENIPSEQLQADLEYMTQFIQDLNNAVETLTNLTVTGTSTLASTSTTALSASTSLAVGSAGATLSAVASTGLVKQSAQTSFTAILPSVVGGVAETGNLDPIPYTDVDYNTGSQYNNSTYTFTAPAAGKYLFLATADVAARAGTPATLFNLAIVTTSFTYRTREIPSGTNRQTMAVSALVNMAANDTAKVTLTVGGGTETWNIAAVINSIFTGTLIN